jgi:hypothetical protein
LKKLCLRKENLQYHLISEMSGIKEGTTTGLKGYGPVAKRIELMLRDFNYQIDKLITKMNEIENN